MQAVLPEQITSVYTYSLAIMQFDTAPIVADGYRHSARCFAMKSSRIGE